VLLNRYRRPNARHQPPRTQPNKHSTLADEKRDIHDRLHGIVLARILASI
jgi:hypothetical protein